MTILDTCAGRSNYFYTTIFIPNIFQYCDCNICFLFLWWYLKDIVIELNVALSPSALFFIALNERNIDIDTKKTQRKALITIDIISIVRRMIMKRAIVKRKQSEEEHHNLVVLLIFKKLCLYMIFSQKRFYNRETILFLKIPPFGWKSLHFIMVGWDPWIKKRVNYLGFIEWKVV